jgi:hypothetical protein
VGGRFSLACKLKINWFLVDTRQKNTKGKSAVTH